MVSCVPNVVLCPFSGKMVTDEIHYVGTIYIHVMMFGHV